MDVRNSRGKLDEINEEFAINPAPIASQLSRDRGDQEELKILLEICLIQFRNQSKLKKIREDTSSFKGEFPPDFEGHLMRSGSGIDGHDRGLNFALRSHDRATIAFLVHPPSAVRWRSGKWVVLIIADQAS